MPTPNFYAAELRSLSSRLTWAAMEKRPSPDLNTSILETRRKALELGCDTRSLDASMKAYLRRFTCPSLAGRLADRDFEEFLRVTTATRGDLLRLFAAFAKRTLGKDPGPMSHHRVHLRELTPETRRRILDREEPFCGAKHWRTLRELIANPGRSMEIVAQELGIHRATLYRHLDRVWAVIGDPG